MPQVGNDLLEILPQVHAGIHRRHLVRVTIEHQRLSLEELP